MFEGRYMMDNIVNSINNGFWADSDIDKLEIDFDTVRIDISLDTGFGDTVSIHCKDYIGFSFVGHWDESVVESIRIDESGTLIDESLHAVKQLYGENPLAGGGVKNIDDCWYQLNIKLIDGNIFRVACKDFETVER